MQLGVGFYSELDFIFNCWYILVKKPPTTFIINCNAIYFSSQEQIAYFLIQEAVYPLVHFKFLRVLGSCDPPFGADALSILVCFLRIYRIPYNFVAMGFLIPVVRMLFPTLKMEGKIQMGFSFLQDMQLRVSPVDL